MHGAHEQPTYMSHDMICAAVRKRERRQEQIALEPEIGKHKVQKPVMLGHDAAPHSARCCSPPTTSSTLRRSLARLLLAPARRALHLRRSLLASLSHQLRTPPAPRSSLLPYATRALLPLVACAARPAEPRLVLVVVVLARCRCWWWWCSHAAGSHSNDRNRLASAFPSLMLQMHVSSVSEVYCNGYIWMLQK
jgi:hypothetical protein